MQQRYIISGANRKHELHHVMCNGDAEYNEIYIIYMGILCCFWIFQKSNGLHTNELDE